MPRQNNRKMRRNKLSNRRNVKYSRYGLQKPNPNKLVIMNDVGRFMPNRIRVKLRYNDTTVYRIRASSSVQNWNYRSSAYDPDSALGSGAIPGFAELANMYQGYLVHSMTLKMEVMNGNGDTAIIGVWPSSTLQNVNSLSATQIIEFSSNVNGVDRIVPPNMAVPVKISCKAIGQWLFGRQFLTDTTYTGSTGGNPAVMYGINVGILNTAAASWTYGFHCRTSIIYDVEFMELLQLQT